LIEDKVIGNKSYIILTMFEELRRGNLLQINNVCTEYEISAPTFRRYISLLRSFFWEQYKLEIVYDYEKRAYKLSCDSLIPPPPKFLG